MTVVSKNVYINRLDEVIGKTYRSIKMKHADVQLGTYIVYGVEHNNKDP